MTKSIRTILKPLLIISYIFGFRIANLSNHLKLWFNVLYMLLVWFIYYLFWSSSVLITFNNLHPVQDRFYFWLEIVMTFFSTIFGIYYNKKFENCLKKLDIVDNTLFRLGIITDYDKLRKKTIWLVLGWFVAVILTICTTALFMKDEYNYSFIKAMFYVLIQNYCFHMNFIGDLITASVLKYMGLKFDQINEILQNYLQNLMTTNKRKMKQAWENPATYTQQYNFSRTSSSKCIIWIIIHLQLELRKIFCEIDLILGTQMSLKMVSYFGWIALDLREILYSILINNYVKNKITSVTLYFIWLSHNVFKFVLINYMYETVCAKASTTRDLLNKLSHFSCDIECHETISQFLLRSIYGPLRFCGVGVLQFGFKFFHRFVMSIATLLVIIIQARANYDNVNKYYFIGNN